MLNIKRLTSLCRCDLVYLGRDSLAGLVSFLVEYVLLLVSNFMRERLLEHFLVEICIRIVDHRRGRCAYGTH